MIQVGFISAFSYWQSPWRSWCLPPGTSRPNASQNSPSPHKHPHRKAKPKRERTTRECWLHSQDRRGKPQHQPRPPSLYHAAFPTAANAARSITERRREHSTTAHRQNRTAPLRRRQKARALLELWRIYMRGRARTMKITTLPTFVR